MLKIILLLIVFWAIVLGIFYLVYRYRSEGRRLRYRKEREERKQTDKIMGYVEDKQSVNEELEEE